MSKYHKYSLTGLAVLLAVAAAPTLSASSIIDVPLPSTCLNDVTQNTGTYNSSCTQRTNISFTQSVANFDSTQYYIGDIFYSSVNETIKTLTMWAAVPQTDVTGPNDVTDAVNNDIGNLTLYLGYIGDSQDGTINAVASDPSIQAWSYPTGTYPPVEYLSVYGPTLDIFQLTFTLSTPFTVTPGCGDATNGCYAWGVVSDNGNFSPLMSYDPNQPYANIPVGDDTYGALTYFSDPPSGLTPAFQSNENSIDQFPWATSVDFTTNPEPATIGLLGIGIGLLGLKARRRS